MSIKRIAISAGHYPERPGAVASLDDGSVYLEHELAKKVITVLKSQLKGRADMGKVSNKIKELLTK